MTIAERKAKKHAYYIAHREDERARKAQYRFTNKKNILAYAKQYRLINRDHIQAYKIANRDKIKAREIKHYQTNRERLRDKTRQQRVTGRERLHAVKDTPCVDCGERYPPYVMDLDHVRGTKVANVGSMPHSSEKDFWAEVDKCDVVCSNCHRERTHQRRIGK